MPNGNYQNEENIVNYFIDNVRIAFTDSVSLSSFNILQPFGRGLSAQDKIACFVFRLQGAGILVKLFSAFRSIFTLYRMLLDYVSKSFRSINKMLFRCFCFIVQFYVFGIFNFFNQAIIFLN